MERIVIFYIYNFSFYLKSSKKYSRNISEDFINYYLQVFKNEKVKDKDDYQFRFYIRLFQSYLEKIKIPDEKILQFWNGKLKPFLLRNYPVEKTSLFIKNSDIEFLINEIDKYTKFVVNNSKKNENNPIKNDIIGEKPTVKDISQKLNLIFQRKNPGNGDSFTFKKAGSLLNIRDHSQTMSSTSTSDEDHPINKTDLQKSNIINDIVYEDIITENININNETEVSAFKDTEEKYNENIDIDSNKNNNFEMSPFSEDLKNSIICNESLKSKTVVIRVMSQYYKNAEECEKENIVHNKNNNTKYIEANLLLKKIVEENFMEKNILILDAFLQQCFSFIKKDVFAKKIINCFKYYKKNKATFNKIQNLIIFLNAFIIKMIEYYNGLPKTDSCLITLKKFYYELIKDTIFNLDINNKTVSTMNLSEFKKNIIKTEIISKTLEKNITDDKKSHLQKKLIFNECQNNLSNISKNGFQSKITSLGENLTSCNLKNEKKIKIPEITQTKNIVNKTKKQKEDDLINLNKNIIAEIKKVELKKINIQNKKNMQSLDSDDKSSNNSKKSKEATKNIIKNDKNNDNKNINLDPDLNLRNTIGGFNPADRQKEERNQNIYSDISLDDESFDNSNNNSNSNSNCSSKKTSRENSLEKTKEEELKDKPLGKAELIELLSLEKNEEINLIKNRQIISNEEKFLLNLNNILKILEKGEYKPEPFTKIKKHQKFFKYVFLKKEKMFLNNKKEETIKRSLNKCSSMRRLGKDENIKKNIQKGYFCILDWNIEDIANSLINISKKMINKVQYKELYSAVYLKKTKEITSHNIVENVTKFNQLVSFIVEDILSYDYPSDRAKVIEKWVDIAEYCKLHRDYNDCVAIICAMNNFIITGLNLTLKEVKKSTKLLINELNEFCTCNGNYKNLRKEISSLKNDEFYIPYLGIILKDLAFYEENSKYIVDGMINLEKIEKVQKSMDSFFRFKYCKNKEIKTIPELNFFENLENLKENDLEALAEKLEPVFKLSKTQNKAKRLTEIDKKYFIGHDKRQSAILTNNNFIKEMVA